MAAGVHLYGGDDAALPSCAAAYLLGVLSERTDAIDCHRRQAVFSLAPLGEGRGEGLNHARCDASPLTLTLSPPRGEGTAHGVGWDESR
jgi:hypothetical protein